MLRLRRYRVFWILAVLILGALYHFKVFKGSTNEETDGIGGLRNFFLEQEHDDLSAISTPEEKSPGPLELRPLEKEVQEQQFQEEKSQEILSDSAPDTSDRSASLKPVAEIPTSSQQDKVSKPAITLEDNRDRPLTDGKVNALPTESSSSAVVDDSEEAGKGRSEILQDSSLPKIYWSKLPEHFPIPSASIIQLPTGSASPILKIQHSFADESANDKISREQKLDKIKKTFEFSWAGYKGKAWMEDELSPVSGKYRNPFCGWGATLVDSLDTLWIMDMKEEFEEAVNSVKDINFMTTERKDIPLFETVIRYLGGLLSAYDLSGGAYRVLLDKAVELAEVLMGAFDTPNRMPIGYYNWKPAFASQPHRAHPRTTLAEIGSLSVEFTRLAQLTREPKYYDAIARITNELAAWQNKTKLPGLWPMKVDASGCKKPDYTPILKLQSFSTDKSSEKKVLSSGDSILDDNKAENSLVDDDDDQTVKDAASSEFSVKHPGGPNSVGAADSKTMPTVEELSHSNVGNIKRQLAQDELASKTGIAEVDARDIPACEPQGLASPPNSSGEEFTIGGQADSVYEYLPKEYMLLGGLEDVYRRMYEMAVETTKNYLLFRPMVPEERDILLSGTLRTSGHLDDPYDLSLNPEGTHLTCFAGGMFAIGAKIFDREDEMDLARKLTDGCVWAYESTATGIMPERFLVLPCPSQEQCAWNETLYHQISDALSDPAEGPSRASQQTVLKDETSGSNEKTGKDGDRSQEAYMVEQKKQEPDAEIVDPDVTGVSATTTRVTKRQLGKVENEKPLELGNESTTVQRNKKNPHGEHDVEEEDSPDDGSGGTHNPPPTPTLQETSEASTGDGKHPLGMTKIISSSYILRPEAIESVFIMYRITGDSTWREKGWTMFEAISRHTAAKYGASGIKDVTSSTPEHTDMMESFWLSETLKYFYLLFSDPSLISLDEYVFNTEAHPFRRPKQAA